MGTAPTVFSWSSRTRPAPRKDQHRPTPPSPQTTCAVLHRARHRPDHSNQCKRPARLRIMSGRRNASRSRLQSANSAKVRRHADRSAAIAAHTARRKPRRNRRRLAAARSARSPRQVPGIVGSPIKKIVRLPSHQQFGRVRHSQDHRSRRPQTAPPAEHPSAATYPSRKREPASQRCPATSIADLIESGTPCSGPSSSRGKRLLSGARLRQHSLRLIIDECVQPGIQPLDAFQVSARHIDGRNFFASDRRRNFSCRKKRAGCHDVGDCRKQNSGYQRPGTLLRGIGGCEVDVCGITGVNEC